ncbi:MAG: cupin domain-containing protein [Solirubrobacteraceae bacterium]|nr:cupin domain-containing protein [Solirubrobacteraceae bacterium]
MANDPDVTTGEGYSVSSLERLGQGYGFRKIRKPMGITAFGANGVVMPPDYASRNHFHESQEELYFVHEGAIEFTFGDGTKHRVEAGGLAWVAPHTVRQLRSVGDADAVYLAIGGKDGYVGHDGRAAPDVPPVA